MITFLFVDIFDTAGTLYSVGRQAGYVDENDELMNSDEAFMSDAGATIVGALTGTSTTTTYIESVAGVEEGGKTGLDCSDSRSSDANRSILFEYFPSNPYFRNGFRIGGCWCYDDETSSRH